MCKIPKMLHDEQFWNWKKNVGLKLQNWPNSLSILKQFLNEWQFKMSDEKKLRPVGIWT